MSEQPNATELVKSVLRAMNREVRIKVEPSAVPFHVIATFYQDGEVYDVQACNRLGPLKRKIAEFLGLAGGGR